MMIFKHWRGRKELVLSTAGQFVLKPFKLWKVLRNVFPGAGGSGPRGLCTSGIACAGNCSVCGAFQRGGPDAGEASKKR